MTVHYTHGVFRQIRGTDKGINWQFMPNGYTTHTVYWNIRQDGFAICFYAEKVGEDEDESLDFIN